MLRSVNDFVVKFANVNGSGSASANALFAKSILRMGIPASSRNIFPSNIQGLPTWYEVRISESGHLGRRGGVDMMVAMNPETWDEDLAEIEPGGYLFYDSTKPLPPSKFRDDINVIGAPLTANLQSRIHRCPAAPAVQEHHLSRRAVRAAGHRCGGDRETDRRAVPRQGHADQAQSARAQLGRDWALAEHRLPDRAASEARRQGRRPHLHQRQRRRRTGLRLRRGDCRRLVSDYPVLLARRGLFGSIATAIAATPKPRQKRYAIIQAEDELASIGIVIGAAWNGARAFTATSGPGISLMQEFIGLAYFAEIPAVIFDIQRGGPSTGMPTRTQQADILSCAYASHGDTKHVLLFPKDPRESFAFAAEALDLADRLQTPIFVMLDLDIGMNEWLCEPLAWDESRHYDRGKVMTAEISRPGWSSAAISTSTATASPIAPIPGTHPTRGAFFTRGTSKDRYARYSEEGPDYVDNMQRLLRKFETAKRLVPRPIKRAAREPTRFGAIYFGSTAPAMNEALEALEARGIHLDTMRIRAFPFHDDVLDFVAAHERVFVVEQNRDAQLRTLLISEGDIDPARLVPILHYDGTPITARFIVKAIADMLAVVTLRRRCQSKALP